jgi:hypothetical protein
VIQPNAVDLDDPEQHKIAAAGGSRSTAKATAAAPPRAFTKSGRVD